MLRYVSTIARSCLGVWYSLPSQHQVLTLTILQIRNSSRIAFHWILRHLLSFSCTEAAKTSLFNPNYGKTEIRYRFSKGTLLHTAAYVLSEVEQLEGFNPHQGICQKWWKGFFCQGTLGFLEKTTAHGKTRRFRFREIMQMSNFQDIYVEPYFDSTQNIVVHISIYICKRLSSIESFNMSGWSLINV